MKKTDKQTVEQGYLWPIRFTFVDDKMNGLTPIGGGSWKDKEEQLRQWSGIPEFSLQGYSGFIADLLDNDASTILAQKRVSAETCERLIGRSIESLVDEGRKTGCTPKTDQWAMC